MLPPPDAEPSEMLVAVGRVLALDLPLEDAMRRVTRLVTRAFGADMGGAYFLDAAREALAPLAGYHVPRDLMETFRQTPFPLFLAQGVPRGGCRCPSRRRSTGSCRRP